MVRYIARLLREPGSYEFAITGRSDVARLIEVVESLNASIRPEEGGARLEADDDVVIYAVRWPVQMEA